MKIAAIRKDEPRAYEMAGTVVAVDDGAFVVRSGRDKVRAHRAASCLLAPANGDYVLYTVVPGNRAYVLAVLERRSSDGANMTIPGRYATPTEAVVDECVRPNRDPYARIHYVDGRRRVQLAPV